MGFSSQEYWSGLPFPSPGDLPDPGIKPASLMSLAPAGGFSTTSTTSVLWGPSYHLISSRNQFLKLSLLFYASFPPFLLAHFFQLTHMLSYLPLKKPQIDLTTSSSYHSIFCFPPQQNSKQLSTLTTALLHLPFRPMALNVTYILYLSKPFLVLSSGFMYPTVFSNVEKEA